jgi:hypothetical protein
MNSTTNIKYLPTKANIVQRLLEEKHITAEEAVILLTNDTPVSPVAPTYPYPVSPFPGYPQYPYVYCSSSYNPQK